MRKKTLIFLIFFIFGNLFLVIKPVVSVLIDSYDGYIVYTECCWNNEDNGVWFYYHSDAIYNDSLYYLPVTSNITQLEGYKIRNPEFINATIYFWEIGNDFPAEEMDVTLSILVNLAELDNYEFQMRQVAIPPGIPDSDTYFFEEDLLQKEVTQNYLVLNISSEASSTNHFEMWFFVRMYFIAEAYNYLTNTLVTAIVDYVPTFLVVFLFPLVMYDYNKKLGFFLGLVLGGFVAFISNLITYDLVILLTIIEFLLGYYYLKKESNEVKV